MNLESTGPVKRLILLFSTRVSADYFLDLSFRFTEVFYVRISFENYFFQSFDVFTARYCILHSRIRKRTQQIGSVGIGRHQSQQRQTEVDERTVHFKTAVQNSSG